MAASLSARSSGLRLCGFAQPQKRLLHIRASTSASAPTSQAPPNVAGEDASKSSGPFEAVRHHLGNVSCMAAVGPLASAGLGTMDELYGAFSKALDIYLVLLTVRVLLTWFRNINWGSEPFNTLRQFTDPYLNLFRGVIPAIGGMDLSPMLGFFLLSFAAKTLRRLAAGASLF